MAPPSINHEIPIDLIRECPEVFEVLLRFVLDYPLPKHTRICVADSNMSQVVPTPFAADLVLRFEDATGKTIASSVVESQLRTDEQKRVSWPVYVSGERARTGRPTFLVVLVQNEKVERWASQPIELGHPGFVLKPLVVNLNRVPRITRENINIGKQFPELAVLSGLAHGNSPAGPDVILTMHQILSEIASDRVLFYRDYVWNTLSEPIQKAVEALMEAEQFQYKTEFARKYYGQGKARGEAQGEAKGKASSILVILAARGLTISDEIRSRITSNTDNALFDEWLRRAATAKTAVEVFG